MNKADLVQYVVDNSKEGLSKKQAAEAVDLVWDGIADALGRGEKVQLVGIITVEATPRAARKGYNPQAGAAIDIDAAMGVKFKAGPLLDNAAKQNDVTKALADKKAKKEAAAKAKEDK